MVTPTGYLISLQSCNTVHKGKIASFLEMQNTLWHYYEVQTDVINVCSVSLSKTHLQIFEPSSSYFKLKKSHAEVTQLHGTTCVAAVTDLRVLRAFSVLV